MKILNYLSFIISSIIYLKLNIKKKKYDVIFVYAPSPVIHSLIGIYLKKIHNSKLIIWLQDLWPASLESSGQVKNKLILNFVQNLIDYIYSKVDILFIQSKAYKNYLKKKISISKLIYLPNACSDLKKNFLYKSDSNLNIMYTGNIGTVQVFDTILYAAKRVQEKKLKIKFFFIGEGVNKNLLKKKVIINGLKNFYIRDYVSQKKLFKQISKADVFYVSLKNFKELNLTIPSKIQFYMSIGKPILAELSGESSRIIKESNSGLVSFPGNKKKLLNNIIKLYNLKKLNKLNNLSHYSHEYFKKYFLLDKTVFKIKECLNKLKY